MKKPILILMLFCNAGMNFGQNNIHTDSLKRLLTITREDSLKALAIGELADIYLYSRPDSCLYFANLGLELIKERSVREQFENSNNPQLYRFEMLMYANIGTALAEVRNDALAVKMTLRALQIAENSKDKYSVHVALGFVAEVYQFIGEPGIAIGYLRKKIAIDTSTHTRMTYSVIMGTCFFDKGDYDSALHYLTLVGPEFRVGRNLLWSYPHLYLGKTYAKKNDYQLALRYYRTAIRYAILSDYSQDLCDASLGIADVYKALHKDDSAILYAKSALLTSETISLPDRVLDASSFLASMYEAGGQKDSAIKYMRMSGVLRDSLYSGEKIKEIQNYTFEEKLRQREILEQQAAYKNRIRFYFLLGGIAALLLIALILYRNNKSKQRLNAKLRSQKDEIENALSELKLTQSQLVQSEKMASLGELAAGIAHEIQNPLNFVNNFSDLNQELLTEMKDEIGKGNYEEVKTIAEGVIENEKKINHHGKRADGIVKGMLQHSRGGSGKREKKNINALVNEYLLLAYHGLRAREVSFNVTIETSFDDRTGEIEINPQDIGRVLINLFNNAFYSMNEKRIGHPEYAPVIRVATERSVPKILIRVEDNGMGIPKHIIDKMFQPFFTTKPTGQGTGLGLSICYDIIKSYGGLIRVETREGEGSTFIIELPVK